MKYTEKMFLIAALSIASFMNANNGFSSNFSKTAVVVNVVTYQYLYQSTCGWTFNMSSDIRIDLMTDAQYNAFMEDVYATNEQVSKIHGQKPVANFTFIPVNAVRQ